MRKQLILLFLLGSLFSLSAQQDHFNTEEKPLIERVMNIEKKNDVFKLFLNMNGSLDMTFEDQFDQGGFKMRQLRIEAVGEINDWLWYRWRQRLNKSTDPKGAPDNLPAAIDYAGVGIRLNKKFTTFVGKQCAVYGGMLFDLNPIEVYDDAEIWKNITCFFTGIKLTYDITSRQQLQFQVLNNRNASFKDTYHIVGDSTGLKDARMPVVVTLNWNGNFNNVFKTRWSASYLSQARGKQMFFYAAGNQLNLGNFKWVLDAVYSREGIDSKGLVSQMLSDRRHNAFDVEYTGLVSRFDYRFSSKINAILQGVYETASTTKAHEDIAKGKFRTSLGYLCGVEYFPMKSNFRLYLTYTGRTYNFTHRAKIMDNKDNTTNTVSAGFAYALPVF